MKLFSPPELADRLREHPAHYGPVYVVIRGRLYPVTAVDRDEHRKIVALVADTSHEDNMATLNIVYKIAEDIKGLQDGFEKALKAADKALSAQPPKKTRVKKRQRQERRRAR